jgi:cytochrome c oxidase subunit 2
MLDFLFSGWGGFWVTMGMLLPFAGMFWYVIHRKSVVDSGPGTTPPATLSRLEGYWLTAVFVIFVGLNLASLKYMPIIATARAATGGLPVQEVQFTATSWSYEISKREVEAGKPVRFAGRSKDTMHGFGVYHPDGRHAVHDDADARPEAKPPSLVHTFREPGKYKVRCLEYCGVAHHAMKDELVVVASNS